MKILVMGFSKIKYMPYMNFYLDNIDRVKNDVHLLYWNRDMINEDLSNLDGVTLHEYRRAQADDVSKLSKIGSFIGYRKFAKKLLKNGDFDFVIVLHSLPGVLNFKILEKCFFNKFIFDYRDSTYEGFAPYKKIIARLVNASRATFVSSDAFRKFLPSDKEDKIFTSHNILADSLNHRREKLDSGTESSKIRIAFWGFIRHEEVNRELIEKIGHDNRFELHYYGREQQIALNLKEFVKQSGFENVFFHGEYTPEQRYEFVRNTDLIHNLYRDGNTMLAMGNKYYDGVIFYLPQLCMNGSFMAEKAKKADVGFECDPCEEDFCNKVYNYYSALDKSEFLKNCNKELEKILDEYKNGCDFINRMCFGG